MAKEISNQELLKTMNNGFANVGKEFIKVRKSSNQTCSKGSMM